MSELKLDHCQDGASQTEVQPPTIQQIVERYLPGVEWMDQLRGRAKCPGHHLHTVRSHRNDCWVYINGVPTVTCLHNSCRAEVAEVNSKIRTAWGLYQPPMDEKVLQEAKARTAKRYALEEKAKASLPVILREYKWDAKDIEAESQGFYPVGGQTGIFLGRMFKLDDVIWVGEPETTGNVTFKEHFQPMREWYWWNETRPLHYHFTCASTFKPGTYSRSNINVATTPYLIVEGDHVLGKEPETEDEKLENKNACGAIFNWLRTSVKLELRCVIDAGNKSLHGWFNMPSMEKFEELKLVLPQLGCDRAMFKPTQPARLPGVTRDNGKEQMLLWIA